MGRRDLVARALDRSGALSLLLRLGGRARPWLSIFTYHRVLPTAPGDDFPYDSEVVDATSDQFEEQVLLLKRHHRLVVVEELCEMARRGRVDGNAAAITFDDGYRDNHDHVLPILRRHGVRATFFIATSHLTERRIFWWDQIAYLVKRSPRTRIEIDYPQRISVELGALPRAQAVRAFLRPVKAEVELDLPRYLDGLARAADVEWNDAVARRIGDELLMTWDQVRALRGAGMDVQSHTRNHRVLHTLPKSELRAELEGSRVDLERELGKRVCAVAYPTGVPIVGEPTLERAVRDAGYEIGLTNATGTNPRHRAPSPLDIRRISLDRDFSAAYFRAMLALPVFAY